MGVCLAIVQAAPSCPAATPSASHTLHHVHGPAVATPEGHETQSIRRQIENARTAREALLAREKQQGAEMQARIKAQHDAEAQAQRDAARATELSAATVDATARLQRTEQDTADLDSRIAALHTEQDTLHRALTQDVAALTPLLPVVERLSLYPADTLLAVPLPADRAVTGLLVMRGLTTRIAQQARQIHDRRARLAQLDAELAQQKGRMTQLLAQQESQRDSVNRSAHAALEAQRQSNAAVRSATQQVEDAARKASSLQDAIGRIEEVERTAQANLERAAQEAERAHRTQEAEATRARARALAAGPGPGVNATRPGSAGAPVPGSIVTGWGQSTESGPASGVTYAPPSRATVRAPCSGRVDFAGPFRSYGQMMILNCGQHYRFVLAGIGDMAVAPGQQIVKGAPVGQMPAWSGAQARPTLFVQLRRGGTAVNPAPYL
ncbi:murein hydrolase activator EnvC family protein [Gluconacetobacter entanii]|uniref:murein hydrolase activator EnvC family protein n=1 Tax=Gluconacetobacter entanii TaxID=108528 RepID=UPI002235755D|nr:peptidoglycan DD-metalloendopeptidase family protein [Gluconacetobacter entanii]MCW4579412.1 peptidoglycan DD-metalloendopeptidase family protein [Gluconacetobacter entanii]MCW4582800.1 peptidoglycan DD-metalloendopeptidase family protein [Gluconacetobacter entanii]MCW4586199.1 peptidoglycan DD-metalloendopeptidase family protein [Gluconacetobacter entanii]